MAMIKKFKSHYSKREAERAFRCNISDPRVDGENVVVDVTPASGKAFTQIVSLGGNISIPLKAVAPKAASEQITIGIPGSEKLLRY